MLFNVRSVSYRSRRHAEVWGKRIARLRRDAFMTQEQFAQAIVDAGGGKVSLTRSSVANWEAGNYVPALRYRPLIADVLEQDVRLLFEPLAEFDGQAA